MTTIFHTQLGTVDPIKGTIRIDNESFVYEIYLLPLTGNEVTVSRIQNDLIKRLGGRRFKGAPCLGITEDIVRSNILSNNYSGIGFVHNERIVTDSASATLQFHNWLTSDASNEKQMWINDLCRTKGEEKETKSQVSPVKALFRVFEQVTNHFQPHMDSIYLMVDNAVGKEAESKKLQSIYNAYGFNVVSKLEPSILPDSIFMKKVMDNRQVGGRRNKSFRKCKKRSTKKRERNIRKRDRTQKRERKKRAKPLIH
uniref:Uncharacterized protein n=1 Tax=viral metagenome TaxID=1070528 RepID=A0A6C0I2M4_9ZZZZ